MRFVDEYRDAEKARALAARIAELCEPGRSYKFMEICVGHTHTIYKHGRRAGGLSAGDDHAGARARLPRIRSERPAFELHYPHMVERLRAEAHVGRHVRDSES